MKVRNGFVSNSSSSSFCIYGAAISDLDAFKGMEEEVRKENNLAPDEEIEHWHIVEALYDFGDGALEVHNPDGYEIYIGRDWSSIKEDETGLQFKNRVQEDTKKLGVTIPDGAFGTHEATWYS